MTFRTRSKTAINVVPPAADPVVMGHPDLGYEPAELNQRYSVTCEVLDGGTWDALFYPAGGAVGIVQEHELANVEEDTVIFDGPAVAAFRVVFAGLGAAAAPVVHVTPQSR